MRLEKQDKIKLPSSTEVLLLPPDVGCCWLVELASLWGQDGIVFIKSQQTMSWVDGILSFITLVPNFLVTLVLQVTLTNAGGNGHKDQSDMKEIIKIMPSGVVFRSWLCQFFRFYVLCSG